MKGVVFTEFLEMVEEKFGPEAADRAITESDLASGGAYTSVGTYDHHELLRMVTQLASDTENEVADLVRGFGKHLFGRFAVMFPEFFNCPPSTFEFLEGVEGYIHVEVRKLFPDAELPRFDHTRPSEDRMEIVYRSNRPFADLAEGLIAGCAQHFGEQVKIERTPLPSEEGRAVRFSLTRLERVAS